MWRLKFEPYEPNGPKMVHIEGLLLNCTFCMKKKQKKKGQKKESLQKLLAPELVENLKKI